MKKTGQTTNGIMRRLPVKGADGEIDLIEFEAIFYLEARGDDTLVRTRRKRPYLSVHRFKDIAAKLPGQSFVRCHKGYIVNLNRVRSFLPRSSHDYDFRLDPPVNRRIPIARQRLDKIRRILGL